MPCRWLTTELAAAQARECARIIAGWKPLPKLPTALMRRGRHSRAQQG